MPVARAVRFTGAGGTEVISLGEIEVRDPGAGEVRVEVAAAGLNRADILQRRGFYPAPPGAPPDVPGLEYAGTVAAVGHGVSSVAAGDRVMGIAGGGAMATQLVVHERELLPVPTGMDLERAAAIPEVFLTAFDALFVRGNLTLGQRVLIHAVGSGVGTAALQLADLAGARVAGSSRTADKLERCADFGLEHRILVSEGKFADAVKERLGRVDLILDTVGAAYLEENVRALATLGTIVIVGLLGGATGNAPLALLLAKRATIVGTVLRSRPLEEKAAVSRRFAAEICPLFESGQLEPVVDSVMSMNDVAAAHERMESNTSFGKIVLSW